MSEQSREMHVGELLERIDRGDPIEILDVRNEEEHRQWKIEGRRTVKSTNIPYFDFIEDEAVATSRLPQLTGELVVVCAKGGSSAMVADLLRQSGIPAKNLDGGMVAYGQYLEPVQVPLTKSESSLFNLWQINRRGKGCLSYMIVSDGQAAVIDPSRNLNVYESLAARCQARITRVLETHVHADHVSGGPTLAERHSAEYSVFAGNDFELKLRADAPKQGDRIPIGKVTMEVLRTPGHTPGSICYLIAERHLISGDTLFTGAVGRPDLGGHAAEWAKSLYHTLHEKLGALSPDIKVFPAHYFSASEMNSDGVVAAKLGDLRERLPEFRASSEQAFVEAMVKTVRTPPASYAEIIGTNLGALFPDLEHMIEWELGKNECAAGTPH